MAARAAEDSRLVRLTKISLALPEATRRDMGGHAAFLVRKSTFAYFLNDHHGDGVVSVACKALPGDNAALAAAQPGRFYLPAYIGPRGWIALRLDIGKVDWDEVAELVVGSYRLIAPKRLVKLIQRSYCARESTLSASSARSMRRNLGP
jgi:hypothetical protein